MSELEERFYNACPRRLDSLPKGICPLAVMRLKWLRSLGREATEAEEAVSPGCSWCISHQMSGYCFFIYEAKYLPEQGLMDADIASLLNITVPTVKATADRAIERSRQSAYVTELKEAMGGEQVVQDRLGVEDEFLYCE